MRGCFPKAVQDKVHLAPELETVLLSLRQAGQIQMGGEKQILVVDVGGGTTNLVRALDGRGSAAGGPLQRCDRGRAV